MHSTHGRAFLAVREDEIAAEAMGINTTNYKVKAFVISAFFAGIAGSMFGHYLSYLNPSTFTFMKSIDVVVMVVLGGMGNIPGVILGAFLLTVIPELLRDIIVPVQQMTIGKVILDPENGRMLLFGIALVVMMLVRPEGIYPSKRRREEFKHSGE